MIRKALGHIISCKDASRLVSQREDAPLSAWQRLRRCACTFRSAPPATRFERQIALPAQRDAAGIGNSVAATVRRRRIARSCSSHVNGTLAHVRRPVAHRGRSRARARPRRQAHRRREERRDRAAEPLRRDAGRAGDRWKSSAPSAAADARPVPSATGVKSPR